MALITSPECTIVLSEVSFTDSLQLYSSMTPFSGENNNISLGCHGLTQHR